MPILWQEVSFHLPLSDSSKRQGPSVALGVLVGQANSPSVRKPHFHISATLCCPVLSLPLLALVDSGAEGNFLDQQVAVQMGISLLPLEQPQTALAVDGRLLARVTHRSEPLTLTLSGNHRETIQPYIISAPSTPLILGHPWLVKHNPDIDWAKGRVSGWSSFCHATCLQ